MFELSRLPALVKLCYVWLKMYVVNVNGKGVLVLGLEPAHSADETKLGRRFPVGGRDSVVAKTDFHSLF